MSSIVSHPTPLTWDEFLALPYETRNAALIDGEVVVNPPNALHELIVGNPVILFREWLRTGVGVGLASGDVITSPLLDGFHAQVDDLFDR